jgi:hypothetical protein
MNRASVQVPISSAFLPRNEACGDCSTARIILA